MASNSGLAKRPDITTPAKMSAMCHRTKNRRLTRLITRWRKSASWSASRLVGDAGTGFLTLEAGALPDRRAPSPVLVSQPADEAHQEQADTDHERNPIRGNSQHPNQDDAQADERHDGAGHHETRAGSVGHRWSLPLVRYNTV